MVGPTESAAAATDTASWKKASSRRPPWTAWPGWGEPKPHRVRLSGALAQGAELHRASRARSAPRASARLGLHLGRARFVLGARRRLAGAARRWRVARLGLSAPVARV